MIVLAVEELGDLIGMGDAKQGKEVTRLLRRLMAKGRAAGIVMLCATQKPSEEAGLSPSLRDMFAFRLAFRTGAAAQSDVILRSTAAREGFDATKISKSTPGVGLALAEDGVTPRRFRAFFLDTPHLVKLAARAQLEDLDARREVQPGPCLDPAHRALPLMKTPRDCVACAAARRWYLIDDGGAD
jgi:S-DNA-T family DNA segregation ATPase FtsK/SpoIIIE